MMYNYGYMGSPFHIFGFIGGVISFVFWIFIIVLIFKLVRRRHHGDWRGMWRGGSALETLRERYAKGEISKEEYEERKKVLMER